MDQKQCSECGRVLPVSEFYAHKSHNDGLRSECKVCTRVRNKSRYHEVLKADHAYKERVSNYGKVWYQQNAESVNARNRRNDRALREACLAAYGGKCECCGETRFEFLALHHRDGGGSQHRKDVGSKMARWLAKNSFPQNLNIGVLCHNCNTSLGMYGYCPHQLEKSDDAVV